MLYGWIITAALIASSVSAQQQTPIFERVVVDGERADTIATSGRGRFEVCLACSVVRGRAEWWTGYTRESATIQRIVFGRAADIPSDDADSTAIRVLHTPGWQSAIGSYDTYGDTLRIVTRARGRMCSLYMRDLSRRE